MLYLSVAFAGVGVKHRFVCVQWFYTSLLIHMCYSCCGSQFELSELCSFWVGILGSGRLMLGILSVGVSVWEGVSEHFVVPLEFAVDQVEYAALIGMYVLGC